MEYKFVCLSPVTNWGQDTHICVIIQTIIDSDNGLSPVRRQAIIRTNAGLLSVWSLRTYFSDIFFYQNTTFWRRYFQMHIVCKMLTILSRSQCVPNATNIHNRNCHLLSCSPDASILIRCTNILQRNEWLKIAQTLKGKETFPCRRITHQSYTS